MLVAEAAAAALGDDRALQRLAHVGKEALLPGIALGVNRRAKDQRADRHRDDEIVTGLTGFVVLRSGVARFGAKNFLEPEVDQRAEVGRRFEEDVAAAPAIAAGRPALGHVFLAPPGDDAVTAVAGLERDRRFIDELHADRKSKREPRGSLLRSVRGEQRLTRPR